MVKIPVLKLDGRNWKIYRAKLIEAAATHIVEPLGVLAGWEENDGSDDWEGQDATAKFLIYPTLPLELLRPIRKLNTAHEMFVFLARRFHDYDPIERDAETKLTTCANDDKRYLSAKTPTSKNAATGAEQEDLPMKALNRGTKDVNDRNVGREDPRMSADALAKGTSAECADGTVVLLKSEPHEPQNEPQNSLPLTPRLPIEGEPNECKQEVAESIATAATACGVNDGTETDADVDRTALLGGDLAERACGVDEGGRMIADINRTATLGRESAKTACGVDEGTETVVDVDETALLGREPVERVSEVGEGTETERDSKSRLQQTNCEANGQRNENANADVPNAYGLLPLEGEWTVCASGEGTSSSGHAKESNAALSAAIALPETADGPSESRETEDATEHELESRNRGTSERASVDETEVVVQTPVECCQQLCIANGNGDRGVEPVDVPVESETLKTVSIQSEEPNGGGIPRVHLGGTRWRAGDANGPGCGTDMSRGQTEMSKDQADALRRWTDTLDVFNGAETAGISHSEGARTYLGVGGTKRAVNATNGIRSHTDASTGHGEVPSVETDALTPENATQNVSTPPKKPKPPDLPGGATRWTPEHINGFGSHADASSGHRDVPNVLMDALTTANEAEIVRTHGNSSKTPNSPIGSEKWLVDEADRTRNHASASSVRTDVPSVETHVKTTANEIETVRTRQNESGTQNLPDCAAKWTLDEPNGFVNRADASSGHWDVQSVETEAIIPANATQIVSIPRKKPKPPDSPIEPAKQRPDEPNGFVNPADASSGHTDVPGVETDARTTADATKTVRPSRNDSKTRNSPESAAKWTPDKPDGCGSQTDASNACMDVHCGGNETEMATNEVQRVRTSRNAPKMQDSLVEAAKQRSDEPNGSRDHTDGLSVRTETHSVGNATETAENEAETVRTRQNGSKTQDSPNGRDISTPKLPRRWKRVSTGEVDVYAPWNAPVEALGTANRTFAFGEVESRDEAIAPGVEVEKAGDGDGDGNGGDGDDGDANGTTSGGDADSMRVKAALLAAKSQYMRYRPRSRRNDLPTSSGPPIQPERCPYGLARCRPRRGRLEIERINGDQVSKAQKVETTHLAHAYATQPPENDPNQAYGVIRPRRRRGRIKIEPINVSRTRNGGNAHLGCVNAIQSMQRPEKKTRRVSKLTFEFRMLGERWRDDGDYG